MYLIRSMSLNRPWQGDIYKDVTLIQDVIYSESPEGEKEWNFNEVTYNYSIVLTQECDLEQDFKNRAEDKEDHDKYIHMILMAPAYLAESLRCGGHLEDYGQKMQRINSKEWDKLKRQENKRYYHLEEAIDKNIFELTIDFKHFYTISRDYFYNNIMNESYIASLTILYREELSQRFCNYISRIGIPNNINQAKFLADSLYVGFPSEPS
jgi:hypothetical protein